MKPEQLLQASPVQQAPILRPELPTLKRTLQPQSQLPLQRSHPILHKLSSSEMIAVRQLVTGYRESAAFLLRSADELESLLLNQNIN